MGWPGHPIFGQGVAGATPTAKGVVRPPQKAKKKKKKKKGFGLLGVARLGRSRSTPKPLGVVRPPPKVQNPFFVFFFFFLGLLGVARPPPWAWGWFDHPRPVVGVALATPDFHLFHFFCSIFISLFFFRKKKKKNLMAKQRRFGLGGCCNFGISQG
jgi:hypothetical protein